MLFHLCTLCMQYLQRPEEGNEFREIRVDMRPPCCGCLEWNPGPLEEQPLLLTAETPLQP